MRLLSNRILLIYCLSFPAFVTLILLFRVVAVAVNSVFVVAFHWLCRNFRFAANDKQNDGEF